MRKLTSLEIVELWESCSRFHPLDRALSILMSVFGRSRDELASLPISQRDVLLLNLRKATFGDSLPGKKTCPKCSEVIEFSMCCSELAKKFTDPQCQVVQVDDYKVMLRPLNSYDLALAACDETAEQGREKLLNRSLMSAHYLQEIIELDNLPLEVREHIAENVADTDPWAEIYINLDCPKCDYSWAALFDIGHIFWVEISMHAKRLLVEVHQLAKAYGWSEKEVLSLSDQRRATYLQMVAS